MAVWFSPSALHITQHFVAQVFLAGSPCWPGSPPRISPWLWILCTQFRAGTKKAPTGVWQMGKNLDPKSWRPSSLVPAIMERRQRLGSLMGPAWRGLGHREPREVGKPPPPPTHRDDQKDWGAAAAWTIGREGKAPWTAGSHVCWTVQQALIAHLLCARPDAGHWGTAVNKPDPVLALTGPSYEGQRVDR